MNGDLYIYILITALVTYALRVLPLTLMRKPIQNTFIRSFLYYVPYVTLSAMTFPAIIEATQTPIAGIFAFIVGVVASWFGAGLFSVASLCCVIVFITEMIF